MTEELDLEKWARRLRRHYHTQGGVADDFPSKESAREAWRRALVEDGYKRKRRKVWFKLGYPLVMEPW